MSTAYWHTECDCCDTGCCPADESDPSRLVYLAIQNGTAGFPTFPGLSPPTPTSVETTPCYCAALGATPSDTLALSVFGADSTSLSMPVSSTTALGAGVTFSVTGTTSVYLYTVGTTFSGDMCGGTRVMYHADATKYTLDFDEVRRVCLVSFFVGYGTFSPVGVGYTTKITVTLDDGTTDTLTDDAQSNPYVAFSGSNGLVVVGAYNGRSITQITVEDLDTDGVGLAIGQLGLCTMARHLP